MAVLIASGKSLKLEKFGDKLYVKDVYQSSELATASAGRLKMEKGFLVKDWTYTYDEVQYVVKGSQKVECEGKTYVAHEGDFILFTKGSKVTQSADEEFEAIFIMVPSLREAGIEEV